MSTMPSTAILDNIAWTFEPCPNCTDRRLRVRCWVCGATGYLRFTHPFAPGTTPRQSIPGLTGIRSDSTGSCSCEQDGAGTFNPI